MKSLKDRAAQYKWRYEEDTMGIIVKFNNGFLRQNGGAVHGRFYLIEVPLADLLTGQEIRAVKDLPFSTRLVDAVGKFNVGFTLVSDDDVLFNAVRKILEWRQAPTIQPITAIVPAGPKPTYAPLRLGEKPQDYCRRTSMTMQNFFSVVSEIPNEGGNHVPTDAK